MTGSRSLDPSENTSDFSLDFPSGGAAAEVLGSVPWNVVRGLRGNPHDSLIGLVSRWWIESGDSMWVLDGPPKQTGRFSEGRRHADLVLGSTGDARGVVEVEGSKYLDKIDSLANYLDGTDDDIETITTGILLAYAYPPERRKVPMERLLEKGRETSFELENKWIVLVEMTKIEDPMNAPIMQRTEYYRYAFDEIRVTAIRGGSMLSEPVVVARLSQG